VVDVPLPPYAGIAQAGSQQPTQQEVSTLFPTPEADRAGLIQRARVAAARLDKKRVGEIKTETLGSAEAKYEDCDLAGLVACVHALEAVKL
jgi:hypothetical protein